MSRNQPISRATGQSRRSFGGRGGKSLLLCALGFAIVLGTGWSWFKRSSKIDLTTRTQMDMPTKLTLATLITLPASQLAGYDTALLNLLCASAVGKGEEIGAAQYSQILDQWTARVKSETERHLYRLRKHPAEYENSEGYFRMLMMAVVLHEDFGVRYNPQRIMAPEQMSASDGFFANPEDVFLHGLLGPRRMGTCSSMPVLYVALGRRLGYPLKLVTTKGHLFVRWESESERFNLEATGRGMNRHDDEHYRHWPFELTDQEIEAHGYLKSLTPSDELAVFLSIRGQCLVEAGRLAEAAKSFNDAARLSPNILGFRQLFAEAQSKLAANGLAIQRQALNVAQPPHSMRPPPNVGPDPNPLLRIR